ncbi:hypothetical protein F4861DRAFT_542184 [Xylaria intraflava]|nr:hypothetical protein F4861DRAFT_542184 [Xylaria intraflava]
MEVIIGDAISRVTEAVVRRAITIRAVSHIFLLSSNEDQQYEFLPHKKVTMIYVEDFANCPLAVLRQIKGARLCIWSVGCRTEPSLVENTAAMADIFLHDIAFRLTGFRRFRFVYCSERWVEWNSSKNLIFNGPSRRITSGIEKSLFQVSDRNPNQFEVMVARPGGVMKESGRFKTALGRLGGIITVDRLAESLTKLCSPDLSPDSQRLYKTSQLLRL